MKMMLNRTHTHTAHEQTPPAILSTTSDGRPLLRATRQKARSSMATTEELQLPMRVRYQASGAAFVTLEIAGRRTACLVDSGTQFTSVSREEVEAWGLGAQIRRCDDEYYEGTVDADVVYNEGAVDDDAGYDSDRQDAWRGDLAAGRTVARDFRFYIRECNGDALLGLDFLIGTRSVLDLDPVSPTLCVKQLAKPVTSEFEMVIAAVVNGSVLVARPDTGFSGFLALSEEDAGSLGLQTEELHERVEYRTQAGVEALALRAQGVQVEAEGKAMTGRADVWPTQRTVALGMQFLQGATFKFEETNYCVTFPEDSDVTIPEDLDIILP